MKAGAEMITSVKTVRTPELTVEEIQARLPLIESVVSDLSRHWKLILEARGALERAEVSARDNASYREQDRVDEIVEELNRLVDRVNGYIQEIEQVGGIVQEYKRGVVTFPIRLEGRMVRASWRLGEPEVSFWHEVHECYAHRKAL